MFDLDDLATTQQFLGEIGELSPEKAIAYAVTFLVVAITWGACRLGWRTARGAARLACRGTAACSRRLFPAPAPLAEDLLAALASPTAHSHAGVVRCATCSVALPAPESDEAGDVRLPDGQSVARLLSARDLGRVVDKALEVDRTQREAEDAARAAHARRVVRGECPPAPPRGVQRAGGHD